MRSSASERLIFRLASAAALMAGCGWKSQSAGDTASVAASAPSTAAPTPTLAAQAARGTLSAFASGVPRVLRERATHPPAPFDQQVVRFDDDKELQNALDDAGRVIVANASKCQVEVPPEGPDPDAPATSKAELAHRPGRPTVLQPVDCPSDYDDPAWDACSEAMYRYLRRGPRGCVCDGGMMGNGPPARPVPCPKLERKEAISAPAPK